MLYVAPADALRLAINVLRDAAERQRLDAPLLPFFHS